MPCPQGQDEPGLDAQHVSNTPLGWRSIADCSNSRRTAGDRRMPLFYQQRPNVSSFDARALEAPSSRVSVSRPFPNSGLRARRTRLFAASREGWNRTGGGAGPSHPSQCQVYAVDKKNGFGPGRLRFASVVFLSFSPRSRVVVGIALTRGERIGPSNPACSRPTPP